MVGVLLRDCTVQGLHEVGVTKVVEALVHHVGIATVWVRVHAAGT